MNIDIYYAHIWRSVLCKFALIYLLEGLGKNLKEEAWRSIDDSDE